ncbi:MAG: hypothetical protein HKO69_09370 [Woeseiaceae bacterium]|nr:hypothetical protein [Woeseiaceae bacterium]
MTSFDSIVSHQVETLTGELRERTDRQCREIQHEAKQRADALLSQSRREARSRMHEAVLEERRRRESAIVAARHRLDTEARRQLQGRYQKLIDLAWPLLNRELAARWARPGSRAEWCELLVDEAVHLLGKDNWLVAQPDPATDAWSRDDQQRLEELLAARDIPPPEFQPDATLDAGLRIRRGGACLDGTIGGLLARRAAVTGRLLAHWEIEASRATRMQETADG